MPFFGPWIDAPDEQTPPSTAWWRSADMTSRSDITWAPVGVTPLTDWIYRAAGDPLFESNFEDAAGQAVFGLYAPDDLILPAATDAPGELARAGSGDSGTGYVQATATIGLLAPQLDTLTYPLVGPDPSTWPPRAVSIEWETTDTVRIDSSLRIYGYSEAVSVGIAGSYFDAGQLVPGDYTIDPITGAPKVTTWSAAVAQSGGSLDSFGASDVLADEPFEMYGLSVDANGMFVMSIVPGGIPSGHWLYADDPPTILYGQGITLRNELTAPRLMPYFTMRYHQPRYRFVYDRASTIRSVQVGGRERGLANALRRERGFQRVI